MWLAVIVLLIRMESIFNWFNCVSIDEDNNQGIFWYARLAENFTKVIFSAHTWCQQFGLPPTVRTTLGFSHLIHKTRRSAWIRNVEIFKTRLAVGLTVFLIYVSPVLHFDVNCCHMKKDTESIDTVCCSARFNNCHSNLTASRAEAEGWWCF